MKKQEKLENLELSWVADQRLLLRTMCRFPYNFEVLSRGYGKTTFELLALYIMAILYPSTTYSMSAQLYKPVQVSLVINTQTSCDSILCKKKS